MSRHSSVETAQTPGPHPVLAAALSCMDVQLEEELARYRRQRVEQEDSSSPQKTRTRVAHPQESSHQILSFSVPQGSKESSDNSIPEISQELPGDRTPNSPDSETPSSLIPQPTQPPQGALDESASQENPPEDYLASSEQLLRSLDREETSQKSRPKLSERVLTPLGLGSILVLLLTGGLLGLAIVEPEMISNLGRWFNPNSTTAQNPTAGSDPQTDEPKLDTDEFVELDLENLSTIQPSPSPLVPSAPNATGDVSPPANAPVVLPDGIPGNTSNLTRALIPPANPSDATSEQPSSDSTSPAAPAAPTATNLTPAPSPPQGDRFYYAIADYAGASSLQEAQRIVPDAYVRNFGPTASIQMGAFLSEQDAKRLVEKLQQQGVSASVYHR